MREHYPLGDETFLMRRWSAASLRRAGDDAARGGRPGPRPGWEGCGGGP
jgi:hypothetical protein